MKEHTFNFTTFLKVAELPQPKKISFLKSILRGKRFSYWKILDDLAPKVASKEISLSEAKAFVEAQTQKADRRKYTVKALERIDEWFTANKPKIIQSPDEVIEDLGSGALKVRIKPPLAYLLDGRAYVMHVWATNKPALSSAGIDVALYLFKSRHPAFNTDSYRHTIFDTVENHIYYEADISPDSQVLYEAEVLFLDQTWQTLNRQADTRKESRGKTEISPVQPSR